MAEGVWTTAPAASGFMETWPVYGTPSILPTEVKVLYDDRFIYVGARMHHLPGQGPVIHRLHRRDQDSASDWFYVYIDSLHDRRTAFSFGVNAANVQADSVYFGDTNSDRSWDGVWESAVLVDADGWTAELKIPLALLRIKPTGPEDSPQTWGINFSRSDQGTIRQSSNWQVPPRGENAFVSRFPDLTGIEGIRPQLRREFIPYLSAQRKFETAQNFDDRKFEGRAGLDAHWGLSTQSQMDLTVRPDFGQVEVDQAVLNLSTVETFFPEKRAFFLEGSEIFHTVGGQLFYSRRIGKASPSADLGTGETLVDQPLATDITAAAKYTAKIDGINLGVLGASVEPTRARVLDATGTTRKRELLPLTNYGVARLQKSLDDSGSYIGGFTSYAHEAGLAGRDAVVGAVDGSLKSKDRSRILDFAIAHGDAGPAGAKEAGWYAYLRGAKTWSNGWHVGIQSFNAGRDFNPNDLGYFAEADNKRIYWSASRQWDRTWGPLRNWQVFMEQGYDTDQAGQKVHHHIYANGRTDFTNFWSIWAGLGRNFQIQDNRELRTFGQPHRQYLQRPGTTFANAGFDTAGNKPWYVRMEMSREWFPGGPSTDSNLFQNIKLGSQMELQLQTSFTRDEGELRWLETRQADPATGLGGTPVVGQRRLSEFNQTLRLAYAFTPRLTVQLFSQWLAVAWNFRDLQAYLDDHQLQPTTATETTAFSYRIWNVNLITRWEFRPGSTLYVVYTHGATTDALINDRAGLSPRSDLAQLRHLPSDDAVQLKFSWLFR
ncbi:MAG: carbohydrate binding family 9 domain-containing protein [Holophagaceae bacterium]|nr:carbohydrate binding family 9 domain-containing protein [Holophagaceae bacterium]